EAGGSLGRRGEITKPPQMVQPPGAISIAPAICKDDCQENRSEPERSVRGAGGLCLGGGPRLLRKDALPGAGRQSGPGQGFICESAASPRAVPPDVADRAPARKSGASSGRLRHGAGSQVGAP